MRVAVACGLAVACLPAVACRTTQRPPDPRDFIEPLPRSAAWAPNAYDHTAADVAAQALATHPIELRDALTRLEIELTRHPDADRLLPIALDLANAALTDDLTYRESARDVLREIESDPLLKSRLEESIADDPLALARKRSFEEWEILWARTFNAISRPLGQALISGFTLAPVTLASSAVEYAAGFAGREPLSLRRRQALALRKGFLAQHPDGEQSEKIAKLIDRDNEKLTRTLVNRRLSTARRALGRGQPRAAFYEARRALLLDPGNEGALSLSEEAWNRLEANRVQMARSLKSTSEPLPELHDELAEQIAEQLFLPEADLLDAYYALAEQHPSGALSGEARYLLALALHEAGDEDASWAQLEELARRTPSETPMARHAAALTLDPRQNPYASFKARKARGLRRRIAWHIFDNFAMSPRYTALPLPVAYAVDSLAIMQTVLAAPFRLVFAPFKGGPDFQRETAIAGYQYLGLNPEGEHAREVMGWLFNFEKKRENWLGSLRLADFDPDFDQEAREKLADKAATQQLEYASRQRLRDRRFAALREVSREYPDGAAGAQAGYLIRLEAEQAAAQRIRMTRDFLRENPAVAGPFGLGLHRDLVDGELRNGELHPQGVTFIGARALELTLIPESGDEDDEPERVRRQISAERLARVVALLAEVSFTNTRVDREDLLDPDANRDYFFERARLQLTESPDNRSSAESTYVYESLRERYGMVRGRESILPFDLVLQGSFSDLSLGAFPRWRFPKYTPDSFLYR